MDVQWRSTPDKASIFRKAGPQPWLNNCRGDPLRAPVWGERCTNWGSNGSRPTVAQAKGRIERLFETLQDRLVKEMRLAGIDSILGANRFPGDALSS